MRRPGAAPTGVAAVFLNDTKLRLLYPLGRLSSTKPCALQLGVFARCNAASDVCEYILRVVGTIATLFTWQACCPAQVQHLQRICGTCVPPTAARCHPLCRCRSRHRRCSGQGGSAPSHLCRPRSPASAAVPPVSARHTGTAPTLSTLHYVTRVMRPAFLYTRMKEPSLGQQLAPDECFICDKGAHWPIGIVCIPSPKLTMRPSVRTS